jgi:hypothetical protein
MSDLAVARGHGPEGAEVTNLAAARASGVQVPSEVVDAAVVRYIKLIRGELRTGSPHRKAIESDPSRLEAILREASSSHSVPGTESEYERAMSVILDETRVQMARPGSRWAIDHDTGLSVAEIGPSTVFQPDDFVDEHGRRRRAIPILHPSVTVPLAMSRHESERMTRLRATVGNKEFFRHIDDPESVAESARERLAALGVLAAGDEEDLDEGEDVEFGMESPESLWQSPNPSFVRANSLAATLSSRVIGLCGPGGRYRLGSIRLRTSSKKNWFIIRVEYSRVAPG